MARTIYKKGKPYKHISDSGKVTKIKDGKDPLSKSKSSSKSSSSKSKSSSKSSSSDSYIVTQADGSKVTRTNLSGGGFSDTKITSPSSKTTSSSSKTKISISSHF
jgi:hypothetical protein